MIDIISIIKISFSALRVNKMRSALTSLGIIIGVGAVIIMLAIGSGANKQISEQISSMGSNLLIVLSGATSSGGVRMGSGTMPTLTFQDAESIKQESQSVSNVAPILSEVGQVVFGNQNWSTQITGTTPDMLIVRDWYLSAGRMFTLEDVKNATKVCVIGQTVALNLFGDLDPIGRTIRIKGVPFLIIGSLESKGQSARGQDQDDTIIIPITTAQKKLFGTQFPGMVRMIMVKAKDSEVLYAAEKEVAAILRERHHIGINQEDDFSVRNLTETMQMAQQSSNVMAFLLGAIASVSLLVGGIGVMNIMLVSVTERTKEIGIRMAIGAKIWDIRLQFLIEALILSMAGGIAGIIIGVAGANSLGSVAGWAIEISPMSILLSFSFSGIVGIFFGFYPAYKASLLNPIDALRHE
ncbi:MAG: multidrug ABC transporter substrate-binding protein [Candidatus Melainabacteria bacterium RIFOXYA12_FULL_32_12]|nr:MAG: multidrug ABC transporter substrate-binding protein [Candidatus Melainabacteria bacterium RIFOXYA2_FULL_32_9]OGI30488.1 MAG: multidrug ABC transporter substrate-binding protein [Candidatus Melainabacteria bacterium RIFOXYA12_FULL_32_12]